MRGLIRSNIIAIERRSDEPSQGHKVDPPKPMWGRYLSALAEDISLL